MPTNKTPHTTRKRGRLDSSIGSPSSTLDADSSSKSVALNRKVPPPSITSLRGAKTYLAERGLYDDSEIMDIDTIHLVLQTLAATPERTTLSLTNGIMSVCFMIQDAVHNGHFNHNTNDSDTGPDVVREQLESQQDILKRLESSVHELKGQLNTNLDAIKKNAEETRKDLNDIKKETEDAKKGINGVNESLKNRTEENNLRTQPPPCSLGDNTIPPSYASMAARINASTHATAIAKGNDRERQIVLLIKDTAIRDSTAKLTPRELVAKGDLALATMVKDGINVFKGASFVSAAMTKSGAVIYQLNSKGAAQWLKRDDNMENLTKRMGGMDAAHARLFYVLIKFVPVQFNPNDTLSKNLTELNSGLPRDTIIHARYVKAPERRRPGQETAHVLMGFETRELANQVISDGLIIENKRVFADKLLTEPSRCFNCQSVKGDHRAANCPIKEPICARCTGRHRTSECQHSGEPRCINCNVSGHSAADRLCPIFERSIENHRKHTPDAKYRFYPIDSDTRTWELRNDTQYEKTQPPTSFYTAQPNHWDYTAMLTDDNQKTPRQSGPPWHSRPRTPTATPSWADQVDEDDPLAYISQGFPTPTKTSRSPPL